MTDQEFHQKADEALASLDRALERGRRRARLRSRFARGRSDAGVRRSACAIRGEPEFAGEADLGFGAQ